MEQLSAWVGAGLLSAGLSAALLAGAGVAAADTESGSESSSESGSSSSSTDGTGPKAGADTPKKTATESKPDTKPDEKPDEKPDTKPDTKPTSDTSADDPALSDSEPEPEPEPEPTDATPPPTTTPEQPTARPNESPVTAKPTSVQAKHVEPVAEPVAEPVEVADTPPATTVAEPIARDTAAATPTASPTAVPAPSTTRLARAAVTAVAPPTPPSLLDVVGSVVAAVIVNVGSLVINTLQALEALVQGPPVLPAGSTVTVRSSTIELSTGQRVAANWYYPEGDDVPTRMILLQHGFLALGPMYSYTAANLAAETKSIVVTPTLPSNIFAGDDHWLGGTGMAAAIADLFTGDPTALTQSALDAGFAQRYGVAPEEARLPTAFAMAGHSLGGNLVSAAAGFLARNGGATNLVGVITLDGVPTGSTMPDALAALDDFESDGGQYIPIREIGAPANLYNSLSNVKESLDAARPDRFNGVVLAGGVHMDSMQGGNPLIQFAAYVAAGFPQPQNPPAVQTLAVTWLNQWFDGQTSVGDDLEPGSTVEIETPAGIAQGVVIGSPRAAAGLTLTRVEVSPSTPSDVPAVDVVLARLTA